MESVGKYSFVPLRSERLTKKKAERSRFSYLLLFTNLRQGIDMKGRMFIIVVSIIYNKSIKTSAGRFFMSNLVTMHGTAF